MCDTGYTGPECEQKCPMTGRTVCNGKGFCTAAPDAGAPSKRPYCVCRDGSVGQSCPGKSKPPKCPKEKDCTNHGVRLKCGAPCTCPPLYMGTLCEISRIPEWDLARADRCNKRALQCVSKSCTPPMWTILKLRLGGPDGTQVFFPFKGSKIDFFKKIKVVLDMPYVRGGGTLLGLNAVGGISAWVEFPTGFTIRAALLVSISMQFGHGPSAAPPAGRRLLQSAGGSLFDMLATAVRFDLPRGIGIADLFPFLRSGNGCDGFVDKFRLSNVAIYFSTGFLSDMDLALIPGDAYTGLDIQMGITVVAEITLGGGPLSAVGNLFPGPVFQLSFHFLPPFPSWSIGFGVAATLPRPFAGIAGRLTFEYRSKLDPRYIAAGSGFLLSLRLRIGFYIGDDLLNLQGLASIGTPGTCVRACVQTCVCKFV